MRRDRLTAAQNFFNRHISWMQFNKFFQLPSPLDRGAGEVQYRNFRTAPAVRG